MAGDGYQQGGTIVVDKGGKLLFEFVQENFAEHAEPNSILKSLGIESAQATGGAVGGD